MTEADLRTLVSLVDEKLRALRIIDGQQPGKATAQLAYLTELRKRLQRRIETRLRVVRTRQG